MVAAPKQKKSKVTKTEFGKDSNIYPWVNGVLIGCIIASLLYTYSVFRNEYKQSQKNPYMRFEKDYNLIAEEIWQLTSKNPGKAILIDISEEGQLGQTLPGAILLPYSRLDPATLKKAIPDDYEMIVFFGFGPKAKYTEAAGIAKKEGYGDVHTYAGGVNNWISKGFKTMSRQGSY